MARQEGETSNAPTLSDPEKLDALFDRLSDWNDQLSDIELDAEEPQP